MGFVDVEKTIEWMLKRPTLQHLLKVPKDSIVIYVHTDLFPWYCWSPREGFLYGKMVGLLVVSFRV